jgi:peptidoglycan hydrolase-like protein with peptidoglycan-binding domain
MRLIHNVKGISKLIFILLLLVSFIIGALLSYIWALGYYGPWETHLPSKSNVTIENVEFDVGDATSFNVTVLNPSYSPSNVKIEQFLISTVSGILIGADATVPSLPYELSPGNSHTFNVYLNWGSYAGQTVNLIVLISDGSGATFQLKAPSFGNLTVVSVDFYPDLTVSSFNVTVASAQFTTPVDITTIRVNGSEVTTVTPPLPYKFEPDTSVTFKLEYNWNDSQGKTVNIELDTVQGYVVRTTATAPSFGLTITSLDFNPTDTFHFYVTVHNDAASATGVVGITLITVHVEDLGITITEVSPALPQSLQPGSNVVLWCSWDWSGYQGQNATATVTVQATQGFVVSGEATIP